MYLLHFLKIRLDARKFVKRFQGRSPHPRREISSRSPFDDVEKVNRNFFLNWSTNVFYRLKLSDFRMRGRLKIDD